MRIKSLLGSVYPQAMLFGIKVALKKLQSTSPTMQMCQQSDQQVKNDH